MISFRIFQSSILIVIKYFALIKRFIAIIFHSFIILNYESSNKQLYFIIFFKISLNLLIIISF